MYIVILVSQSNVNDYFDICHVFLYEKIQFTLLSIKFTHTFPESVDKFAETKATRQRIMIDFIVSLLDLFTFFLFTVFFLYLTINVKGFIYLICE